MGRRLFWMALATTSAMVACGPSFEGSAGGDGGNAVGGAMAGGNTSASTGGEDPSTTTSSSAGGQGGQGTGGSGGQGGATGSGGSGGTILPEGLVDDGLLARYWIDEAGEGTGPTTLQDAAPNPQPLTITYADGLTFATRDGQRALYFPQADQGGLASASIDGSKLAQLNGATKATLEAVVHLQQATSNGDRIIHFGDLTSSFSLEATATSVLRLDYNDTDGQGIGTWTVSDLSAAGRVVIHAVLNTELPTASDRVRLHVDGVLQTGTLTPPLQNDTISIGTGQSLVLGNRLPATRSMGGYLHYAAVYLTAFSQAQIDQNVTALTLSDDAP